MTDKTEPKDLEKVLARLSEEWQELADLLNSQGKAQDRVMEVEKVLLRDASGHHRGALSANPDGSADLLLSDRAGNAWIRLGVNEAGEAFFELKDQKGQSSFKAAAGAPALETGPGPAAAPAGAEPLPESGLAPELPAPDQDKPTSRGAGAAVLDQLEKLAGQYRRLKISGVMILVVLGVILATQAYVLFRPQAPGSPGEALVIRDPQGNLRASLRDTGGKVGLELWDAQGRRRATLGLGAEGAPGLAFYDQDHRVRAELNLGPAGEPKFTLQDQRPRETQKKATSPEASARPQPPGSTDVGSEAGALPSPPAGPAEAVTPPPTAEAEAEFVGFKRSNKYHYPTCKWARTSYPAQLLKFKSPEEAQERGYIPCPVCKPPPLSR